MKSFALRSVFIATLLLDPMLLRASKALLIKKEPAIRVIDETMGESGVCPAHHVPMRKQKARVAVPGSPAVFHEVHLRVLARRAGIKIEDARKQFPFPER